MQGAWLSGVLRFLHLRRRWPWISLACGATPIPAALQADVGMHVALFWRAGCGVVSE